MKFLNQDFLLTNETAKTLFKHIKNEPIIDYHCHLSPKEIYEDKKWNNLTEIWLGGDHYKWRLMRANGVNEEFITGGASDYDKFFAFVQTLQKAAGNPIYEWSHLELQRYFEIYDEINEENAKSIYDKANAILQNGLFSARNVIENMQVKVVCTTDDPLDNLEFHQKLKEEKRFQVLPSFRPDKALNIEKASWFDYIQQLESLTKIEINSFASLVQALEMRVKYFKDCGCKVSDHGLTNLPIITEDNNHTLDDIFKLGSNKTLKEQKDIEFFKFNLFQELLKIYHKYDLVVQFHFNSPRDFNSTMFEKLGPDTGFDAIGQVNNLDLAMRQMLNTAHKNKYLPTCIWYSLNPNDYLTILTVMQSFQQGDGKQTQHFGSAWWFNDTFEGMTYQMQCLAQQALFGNFIGMLTDSRSFLSYPRHEYFRRVLCSFLASLVESGRIPQTLALKTAKNIAYQNTQNLFNF